MAVAGERVKVPNEIVERFRAIDLAQIGDVLRGLGLNCVEYGIKPLEPHWRFCGPAVTMRLIPLQDRSRWYETEIHPRELIYQSEPGGVLVLDIGGNLDCGIWGGHVASDGAKAGLSGVVIDGVCRDSLEVIEVGVPTFVRATSPMHGHGVLGATCFNNEPVRVGGISVAPGDLVCGDADGIAVVPASRAAEVIELAEGWVAAENEPRGDSFEDKKRRSHQRNGFYGLPIPPEYR